MLLHKSPALPNDRTLTPANDRLIAQLITCAENEAYEYTKEHAAALEEIRESVIDSETDQKYRLLESQEQEERGKVRLRMN